MTVRKRLAVCYVAPGSHLVASAGPTRNVLALASALGERADVSVAFRSAPDVPAGLDVPVLEIEPGVRPKTVGDDSAVRGISYREFIAYLHALRRFARERLRSFDLVLEKNWLLTGYLSHYCRRLGTAAVPVVNHIPVPGRGMRRGARAAARHGAGGWISGRYLRSAPRIIAETEPLARVLERRLGIAAERVRVIGVGVDRDLFRPRDAAAARRALGIAPDATVLLYAGVLDRAHDLGPVIDALGSAPPSIELHIVGDGADRGALEARAERSGRPQAVVFHGRVPHEEVPTFIAAADLCLAPYDPDTFPNGVVTYSTLKIREYMSAGRPVASVASGTITGLVRDGVTGFLVPHEAASWAALLQRLPPRVRLREMGRNAAGQPLESWDDIARAFYEVIEETLTSGATA